MSADMVFASVSRLNRNHCPLLSRQRVPARSGHAPAGRLSSPEGRRRYLFEVPGADPANTAGGQPCNRGDAVPCEAVALAHVMYLLGPLPADTLALTQRLSGGFDPLQARQRSFPGQVPLHLCEDDGQVQHSPHHGAVLIDGLPETDHLDLVLSQPAKQLQHLGKRPAQAVQRRHFHTVPWGNGILQAIQPGPVPGSPTAHILEDLIAVG